MHTLEELCWTFGLLFFLFMTKKLGRTILLSGSRMISGHFIQRLVSSPEAKLAVVNALASLGCAVFVLIAKRTHVRVAPGYIRFSANFYWTMLLCLLAYVAMYLLRAVFYIDPSLSFARLLTLPGTVGGVIAALQLAAALQLTVEFGGKLPRLLRPFRLAESPATAHVVGFCGIATLLVMTIAALNGCLPVIVAAFGSALWNAIGLWSLASVMRHCYNVSWTPVVVASLVLYGLLQFCAIPFSVHRLNGETVTLASSFQFFTMAMAVPGKFVLVMSVFLTISELEIRKENAKLQEQVIRGVVTSAALQRLNALLIKIIMDARSIKKAAFEEEMATTVTCAETLVGNCESAMSILNRLSGLKLHNLGRPMECHIVELVERGIGLINVPLAVVIDRPRKSQPMRVIGDAELLADAFSILLKNAIEAMAGRSGRVQIDATCDIQTDAPRVSIRIVDNGEGIDAFSKAILFEPLESSKPDGLGVGLWLARLIVESFGGSLSLETTDVGIDHGSTFRVDLRVSPMKVN